MHETIECRQVHAAIRGQGALAGELQRHVRECPACAELLGSGGLGATLAQAEHETLEHARAPDFDAMFEGVQQQLARPVGGVERIRQASTRTRSIALLGITATIVSLAAMTLSRADLASDPLPYLIGSVAALVAAALAAGAVVLRPIHRRPLPGWLLGVLAGFAVITPGVIASMPTVQPNHPALELGTGEHLLGPALRCFATGMAFALLLVGAAWLVERSGLRRRAATVLGLVGAAAIGKLVLVQHCPLVAPAHKLLGHASISAVLLAVAGGVAWALTRGR
jgi:drug/metabolite transporter (DMT)-like permease